MKKIILSFIALTSIFVKSQITITKDVSYANGGEFTMSGNITNYKFLGDKLLLSSEIDNIVNTAFVRLQSSGIPDNTFGVNGLYTFNSGNTTEILNDANEDFLITYNYSKYLSNGNNDYTFPSNALISGGYAFNKFSKILSDSKIIFRTNSAIKKINPDGMFYNEAATLPYSLDFLNGIFTENALYESGGNLSTTPPSTNGIRKISTSNGALDTSFGNAGYGFTSLIPSVLWLSQYNSSDESFLNLSRTSSDILISKTLSNGQLDTNFGNSGSFTLQSNFAGHSYSFMAPRFTSDNNGHLFFLEYDENEDWKLVSYSTSGNLLTINSLPDYQLFSSVTPTSGGLMPIIVWNNGYLYQISDDKVTRFIVSTSTLGTSEHTPDSEIKIENPVNEDLKIITREDIFLVNIFDLGGRKILAEKDSKIINVKNLVKGNYIVEIQTKKGMISRYKFIKK